MKKVNLTSQNIMSRKTPVVGNLALNVPSIQIQEYETPKIKKLIIKKPTRKVFMGCWQGCNEENEGDGC